MVVVNKLTKNITLSVAGAAVSAALMLDMLLRFFPPIPTIAGVALVYLLGTLGVIYIHYREHKQFDPNKEIGGSNVDLRATTTEAFLRGLVSPISMIPS